LWRKQYAKEPLMNNADNEVRFYDVHDLDGKKVGQVKHDPSRKNKPWTALGAEGYRIKDVDSRLHAEEEVKDEFVLRPQSHRVHSVDELADAIMKGRHSER
jgi:hypothetical protein